MRLFDGFEIIGILEQRFWPQFQAVRLSKGHDRAGRFKPLRTWFGRTQGQTVLVTMAVAIVILQTGTGGNSVAHDNVIVGTDNPGDHRVKAFYGGPACNLQ